MSKLFISYSRDCEALAQALVADLDQLGHDVWLDRDLSGGQAWWDQILAAIRDCALFVVVLHPRTLESAACRRERSYAVALGRPMLPVQVVDGLSLNLLPPELAQLQIVQYRGGDRNEVLTLARSLARVPAAPPLPDPLPQPPEVPASYLGALAMRMDASATLTFDEQSAILVDLRQAVREPELRADARLLLGRLRKRRDLFAAIADEIDASPERPQEPQREVRSEAVQQAPPLRLSPVTAPAQPAGVLRRPWWHSPALWCALVGAMLGFALGLAISRSIDLALNGAAIMGVGFGLAGAIAGRDRRALILLGVGAAGGILLFGIGGQIATSGGSLGAAVGAVLGSLWRRLRPANERPGP